MSVVDCSVCEKQFSHRRNMLRHVREVHGSAASYTCNTCGKIFTRRSKLDEHKLSYTTATTNGSTTKKRAHADSRSDETPQSPLKKPRTSAPVEPPVERPPHRSNSPIAFVEKHCSHFRNVLCLELQSYTPFNDIWILYNATKQALKQELTSHLSRLHMLKFDLILNLTFHLNTDEEDTITCFFHSKVRKLTQINQVSALILNAFKGLTNQVEQYLERGSGWVLLNINGLDVHISKYRPIRGATYLNLPPKLKHRKATVNVKNTDNKCFMWSILAALYPSASHAYRVSHYQPFADCLKFDEIAFPVAIDDVPKFEALNNMSINVYGYEDEEDRIKVIFLSEKKNAANCISLLLYNQQHYCLIKDPERFLNNETAKGHKQFQCHLCICMFYSANKRDVHVERCKNPDLEAVEMPEETSLEFKNFHKMQRQPYAIYADFECLLEKIHSCAPNPAVSHTTAYQKHSPCSYGLAEVFGCCSDSTKLGETSIYRGEEPVEHFFSQVINWGERYQEKYNQQNDVNMTPQDWYEYNGTTVCNICKEHLSEERVIDHCHFCGSYRGACHSKCNVLYRLSRDVVVVLHNLRRYDGHLLLNRLGEIASKRKGVEIFVIPKGFDDFLTFSIRLRYNKVSWSLKFIDSIQFMSASLAQLVNNLHEKGDDKFTLMASHFTSTQLPLLLRKGICPYDYMDSCSRFNEDKLPSMDDFKSCLTGEPIDVDDYKHAQQVWNKFSIKDLGEYHDLYLITDVLLLAHVFENFRLFCLFNYQLDPAHYFTAPSFSWDACLKKTGVKLELLSDPEMYTFLESGIRGGISIITHRYAKPNNPLVPEYSPDDPSSYIMYLDANNLYGWTMVCPLPMGSFQWLSGDEIQDLNIVDVPDDADTGYIMEVDLEYPEHLHAAHNDYPLAAERLQVTDDMLSPYCAELKSSIGVSNAKVEKLIPNLHSKENYVVHYRNLKLYLNLGLRLKKVHRVLSFAQKAWMAPYINFNTDMRKQAKNAFEKDLFKLFNNSVFGKTMENVRKYIDIKLVCTEAKMLKLASKLEYSGFKVLSDSLWAVKMKRSTVKLDKPIYVGFTVLDLSKLLMYDFHYNYIVAKYGSNAKLLFTDTDSLCYHVYTDDMYSDMHNDSHMFDFSDYPKDHACYDASNKKVMGKFKDELCSVPATEFVGLRAKMYSLLDARGGEKKRAKGVRKSVVCRKINHAMYKNVLFGGKVLKHNMNFIRPQADTITTVVQNKTSLSAYDDKRYVLHDAYSSLAYGNHEIMDCSD